MSSSIARNVKRKQSWLAFSRNATLMNKWFNKFSSAKRSLTAAFRRVSMIYKLFTRTPLIGISSRPTYQLTKQFHYSLVCTTSIQPIKSRTSLSIRSSQTALNSLYSILALTLFLESWTSNLTRRLRLLLTNTFAKNHQLGK
jgi:hypothetical protein